MTRETRIGLLVGLAFIVMFGLVLSELTGTGESVQTAPRQLSEAISEGWSPIIERPIEPEPVAAIEPAEQQGQIIPVEPSIVVSSLVGPQPAQASETVQSRVFGRQAAPAAPAVAAAAPPQKVYTVAAGDSLGKIARAVYGPQNEKEYKRIFEANRKVLEDESQLQIGQQLVIPALPGGEQVATAAQPAHAAAPARPAVQEMDIEQLNGRFLAATNQPQAAPAAASAQPAGTITPIAQAAPAVAAPIAQPIAVVPAPRLPRPAAAGAAAAPQQAAPAVASAVPASPIVAPPAAERKASGRVYLTQPKDTLSKIARRTLNDGSRDAVMKIFNANRDRLSTPDAVPVGVELKIPA